MKPFSRRAARWLPFAFPLLCLLTSNAWAETVKVVGVVVSVHDNDLLVAGRSGASQTVHLADSTVIRFLAPLPPSALTANAFVGATATARPDGTLVASEVHVFPEDLRGRGEGHRPMDPAAGTTMTNATVKSVATAPAQSMTTATVATVAAAPGELKLNVEYKGGSQVIVVPDGTPIVMIEPSNRSALSAGTHVIVYAERDSSGALAGQRISVGKNGSTPPI
jgi:hypothetical protein